MKKVFYNIPQCYNTSFLLLKFSKTATHVEAVHSFKKSNTCGSCLNLTKRASHVVADFFLILGTDFQKYLSATIL